MHLLLITIKMLEVKHVYTLKNKIYSMQPEYHVNEKWKDNLIYFLYIQLLLAQRHKNIDIKWFHVDVF